MVASNDRLKDTGMWIKAFFVLFMYVNLHLQSVILKLKEDFLIGTDMISFILH